MSLEILLWTAGIVAVLFWMNLMDSCDCDSCGGNDEAI